jgi:hypothetical protein
MEQIWIFSMLAVVVEALTEYIKNMTAAGSRKAVLIQLGALAMGITVCAASGADLFAALDVHFAVPWMGCVLTGVFVSRGANYVSDLLKKVNHHTWKEEADV